MIISLHLPKTAGQSFAAALKAHFEDALLEDYGSFPMNTPEAVRNARALAESLANAENEFQGVECIHGHFLPLKYSRLERRHATFVTWVRHPVQRMISNYYYWTRTYQPDSSSPLHRKVVEEGWSLERFCLCDEMRNMYAQFLWNFPVEKFAFIGVTEHYEEDLDYFARQYLGHAVEPERLNVGNASSREYEIDGTLRQKTEAFHAQDMALYAAALKNRGLRRAARST